MKDDAYILFKSCCIFDQGISPSLWTLCVAAPVHAEKTYKDYGFGLGCNTMEGQEQKHQKIAKYAENTTSQLRWPLIFRHEFLQLVYLREHGYDQNIYHKKKLSYLPVESDERCPDCSLLLEQGSCVICSSPLMNQVQKSLAQKK